MTAPTLRRLLQTRQVPFITIGHTPAGWVVYVYEHDDWAHERVPSTFAGQPVRVQVDGWAA